MTHNTTFDLANARILVTGAHGSWEGMSMANSCAWSESLSHSHAQQRRTRPSNY